jgi:hypothetical protein
LKKFFVLLGLLSNEKNSSNSLSTIKFPKNHITSSLS